MAFPADIVDKPVESLEGDVLPAEYVPFPNTSVRKRENESIHKVVDEHIIGDVASSIEEHRKLAPVVQVDHEADRVSFRELARSVNAGWMDADNGESSPHPVGILREDEPAGRRPVLCIRREVEDIAPSLHPLAKRGGIRDVSRDTRDALVHQPVAIARRTYEGMDAVAR